MLRAHVFELTPGKVAVPRAKAIVPEGRMRVARSQARSAWNDAKRSDPSRRDRMIG